LVPDRCLRSSPRDRAVPQSWILVPDLRCRGRPERDFASWSGYFVSRPPVSALGKPISSRRIVATPLPQEISPVGSLAPRTARGLRALHLHQPPTPAPIEPALNWTVLHGVRASLELQRTHDRERALQASNPEVAPHLAFTDVGGHGYAVVRAGAADFEVEFVCVVRPLERSDRPDGGPLAYRVTHRARRWADGAAPRAHAGRGRAAAIRLTAAVPPQPFRGRAPLNGDPGQLHSRAESRRPRGAEPRPTCCRRVSQERFSASPVTEKRPRPRGQGTENHSSSMR